MLRAITVAAVPFQKAGLGKKVDGEVPFTVLEAAGGPSRVDTVDGPAKSPVENSAKHPMIYTKWGPRPR